MAELTARLHHPFLLQAALQRSSLPVLQVTEALLALAPEASRTRLDTLLGVTEDTEAGAAVDQALTTLAEHLLIDQDHCPLAELRQFCPQPLGLGPNLHEVLLTRTADHLRATLRALGVGPASRKTALVAQVTEILTDRDRVRDLVALAPAGLADRLRRMALGGEPLTYYGYYSPRYGNQGTLRDPVEWALARMLLIRLDTHPTLVMPAEVALALRGPAWSAPFTWRQPKSPGSRRTRPTSPGRDVRRVERRQGGQGDPRRSG